MPIQFLQTSSSSSQENSCRNEGLSNPYSLSAYPLTPYPIVSGTIDCSPTTFMTRDYLVHMGPQANENHFDASSALDLYHSSLAPSLGVSSAELQGVLNSLLNQINWLEVTKKVAKNRAPSVYYNAIKQILLAHISELKKAEGKSKGNNAIGFKSIDGEKNLINIYKGENKDDNKSIKKHKDGDHKSEDNDGEFIVEDEDESDKDSEYDSV